MSEKATAQIIGDNWLHRKVDANVQEAQEAISKMQGKLEAYAQVAKYVNPELVCQICGYEYNSWNDINADRAKHVAKHMTPPSTPVVQ
jgi:hypothetical protein